jgi:hypothetical protein
MRDACAPIKNFGDYNKRMKPPAAERAAVNEALVNRLPWSVLKISG